MTIHLLASHNMCYHLTFFVGQKSRQGLAEFSAQVSQGEVKVMAGWWSYLEAQLGKDPLPSILRFLVEFMSCDCSQLLPRQEYSFAKAAKTKCYRSGCLYHTNLFSHSFGSWEPEIEVLAWFGLCR